MTSPADPFWHAEEQVQRFANRDPDERLLRLIARYEVPGSIRVLDLGCAGGRNTVMLLAHGFDVHAIDGAEPMVRHTRERVTPIVGGAEARRRVVSEPMDDLSRYPDGMFDLVVALGIYHQAHRAEEWERAVRETARVLRGGGLVLVSVFEPGSQPEGVALCRQDGPDPLYAGFPGGLLYLVDAPALDSGFHRHGMVPESPTETVRVETDAGFRVTTNALYRRTRGDAG